MKPFAKALACTAGAVLLLAAAEVAHAQETSARYTAQRRPRVAVLEFDDSNTEAAQAKYASSVEAMLVTFLQSNSQFAIVERKKLGGLYEEKRRIQMGLVDPGETAARDAASELLKKADAFILGTVTLLDGTRIEIDTKLFSGFDGRVVATAQRSGPKTCLRSIVERLGVALEQDFLRPYHGNLEIRLADPENARIFLTPIPLDTAPDEEKVPAERSSTVRVGSEFDTVEPWITDPASYTIERLLSGWYSLRLTRPGYEDLKTDPGRFEARYASGKLEVYDRTSGLSLSRTGPELRRFVVRVDPRATEVIDGDALGFSFRKKGGSLAPRVKRQYLDTSFSRIPQRVILMGGKGLDLNASGSSEESGDGPQCTLLREPPPFIPDYRRIIVAPGQTFDFAVFKGGELIIEDYRGEVVPAGQYHLALWDANYRVSKIAVTVRDGDHGKVVKSDLARATLPLTLEATGVQPGRHVILKGNETRQSLKLRLDFPKVKEQRGLPADTYKISTNIPGLDGWKRTLEHTLGAPVPPRYYSRSPAYAPEVTSTYEDKPVRPSSLIVKTRFVLAGRLDVLSRAPDPQVADLFLDEEAGKIFDYLLHEPGRQLGPPEDLRRRLAQRLEVIDLLILNSRDMAGLRKSPETAAIVRDYVKKGGALFAFVSEPGDYGELAGAPLVIETLGKLTDRFDLAPGEVTGLVLQTGRKIDVPLKRPLPEISRLPSGAWRVIAFTQGRESPRILERGQKENGGYVALWLDDPASFRGHQGKTELRVEETRARVEEHVLKWARYLMYRRYDKAGKLRRRVEESIAW